MQPHQGHARLEVLTRSIKFSPFVRVVDGTNKVKVVSDQTNQAEAANIRGFFATETLRIA